MKLSSRRRFVAGSLLLTALSASPSSALFYNRNVDVATEGSDIESGPDANDVKICIIDTGITPNPNLPSLTDGTISGESFVGDLSTWKEDSNGLGTAVAGVIAAHGRHEEDKVKGIVQDAKATGIKLHIARALGVDRSSEGMVSEIFSALEACKNAGARIITMAFDVRDVNNALGRRIDNYYEEEGILIIASSGNSGSSSSWYPASLPSVVSVGATELVEYNVQTAQGVETVKCDVRASFSNYNDQVELSAIGDKVRTTWRNGGYAGLSITEMAAAAVAGGAALLWSYDSSCSAQQIRGLLLKTARQMGRKPCDVEYGWGHIQLKSAVDLLQSSGGCLNGDDVDSTYLDSNGRFLGCPATQFPSTAPSVSPSPTSSPTITEPTYVPPTHSPSFTGKSKSKIPKYWQVGPQCEDQATAEDCCEHDDCLWDSVMEMCTRSEIDDDTCMQCVLGADLNPSTPEDCCAHGGCMWYGAMQMCTRYEVDDDTCRNMSEPPSASPTSRPTPMPTPKPTKAPTLPKPTKPPTPPTLCVKDKKFKVRVKGTQEKCEKVKNKKWCDKRDENSAGNVLVREICCSWC